MSLLALQLGLTLSRPAQVEESAEVERQSDAEEEEKVPAEEKKDSAAEDNKEKKEPVNKVPVPRKRPSQQPQKNKSQVSIDTVSIIPPTSTETEGTDEEAAQGVRGSHEAPTHQASQRQLDQLRRSGGC